MNITQLRINGNIIEGLDESSIKISVNNLSPVTMSGDSVAFSATLKAPRTPANDATFKGMNKGLYNCQFYDAELTVRTVPLVIAGVNSSKFYARVSSNGKEYSISLVQNTDKWADVDAPIYLSSTAYYCKFTNSAWKNSLCYDLKKIINDNLPGGLEGGFPIINPPATFGAVIINPMEQEPTILCNYGTVAWTDLASGSAKFRPMGVLKGRGGYVYPPVRAAIVLDSTPWHASRTSFRSTSQVLPAWAALDYGSKSTGIIVEFPTPITNNNLPKLALRGNVSGQEQELIGKMRISDSVIMYHMPRFSALDHSNFTRVYTLDDYMYVVNPADRSMIFKFPNGYSPDEVVQANGSLGAESSGTPANGSQPMLGIGFPYTDVKKLVDDLCTGFHWRKIFANGTLKLENIIHEDIRDNTDTKHTRIIDWSDKFVSFDGAEVPDESGDEFIAKLGEASFSYSAGPGTLSPVKDAYSSGLPFNGVLFLKPGIAFTTMFNGIDDGSVVDLSGLYYAIIRRHFKLFSSRVQVKIKARLDLHDIEGLKLNYAYYFSQLGGYFYLKSLGEYDVSKGDCKLTLYKLNLS